MSSCVGDLNVTPIDPNADTADKVLVSEEAFTQYLAGVYTGFATSGYDGVDGGPSISGLDGGFSQYIRGLYNLNELTTDVSVWTWVNDGGGIGDLHYMIWSTSDGFVYSFYSRIAHQISAANEFIREAKKSSVDFAAKKEYIAEARVLRALCYLHAIDNFGKFPFATDEDVVGAFPPEKSRKELFDYVESELTDLIEGSDLAAPRGNGYARADKGVAKFLLAKLYLNAEVYTGTAMYDKCATVLKDLMDDGYSLHKAPKDGSDFSAYQELFLADNDTCTDEIIFAIEQDGVNTNSWGVTTFLVFGQVGDGMDASEFGISSGWSGLRTTPQFYDKFDADDARNLFWIGDHQKEIDNVTEWKHGYPFMKFRNVKYDGTAGKESGHPDTDFPMMRYADVLLMAAECQARGASIDGLSAFNEVRERAGLDPVRTLSLDEIIDERGRELYMECWRRSDLIRFGLFTSDKYTWAWKGNTKEGQKVAEYRNLFPIPVQDLQANNKLTQNEGY